MGDRHDVVPITVNDEYTTLWDETCCFIEGFDNLKPFFISLASASDHWLFLSSRGGISAGRRNADNALFPYVNVDQIHYGSNGSGVKTYLLCETNNRRLLWEPFSASPICPFERKRRIYKNISGTSVVFEEQNLELGLSYQYGWTTCEKYGFVKKSRLINGENAPVRIHLLDGLFNILPAGISEELFLAFSSLTDAYKLSELDPQTGLGIFSLTGQIHDRPCPKEMLRSTVVWQTGLADSSVILQEDEISTFFRGHSPREATRAQGTRCQYAVHSAFELSPSSKKQWLIVADVAQDHENIAELRTQLRKSRNLFEHVEGEVTQSRILLDRIVSAADGLQLTADKKSCVHHRTNVLFNVLRGGLFAEGYAIDPRDFFDFLSVRNRTLLAKYQSALLQQANEVSLPEFLSQWEAESDPNIERLALEYLPLCYSRRHGDPSRPWNKFDINIKDQSGQLRYNFEGNWRDIFQNWEALGRAYPLFIKSFIAKFVNASTVDGYNPYRINRIGVEWERLEPDKAWSHIGYWGDHQVVYLLKLLEMYRDHFPGELSLLLGKEIFSYTRVPYRLASFEQTAQNPRKTVFMDVDEEKAIWALEQEIGSDARLLQDVSGNVYHVCLLEKLLLVVLTKLANFVPGGGVWMNTQRPEWNDANNALAGYGLSVITTCHLRRYIELLAQVLGDSPNEGFSVSNEVVDLFVAISDILERRRRNPETDEAGRDWLVTHLGQAASEYREVVYRSGFSAKRNLDKQNVFDFLARSLEMLDSTIADNKREDGLYHSYNLLDISLTRKGNLHFEISRLQEMLEGQVAVLSSGLLDAKRSISLLEALRHSRLYDEERRSYLLYPESRVPGFREKNRIPPRKVEESKLLSRWEKEQPAQQIVYRDVEGVFRFRARFVDLDTLESHLSRLEGRNDLKETVRQEKDQIKAVYELVFSHRKYTGRSGSMFAYEGLGSIYWHMVSKLLYEIQECFYRALDTQESEAVMSSLREAYYSAREGLGYRKSAREFGAFPTDPYSHTPKSGEARQPGMTGQTKEGILIRLGELGVRIRQGRVSFMPWLLLQDEYLKDKQTFSYFDLKGAEKQKNLETDSLAFQLCGVPIIYHKGSPMSLTVHYADGAMQQNSTSEIDEPTSRKLFLRDGSIDTIVITAPLNIDLTKKVHGA